MGVTALMHRWRHTVAVLWTIVLAAALLGPALRHGSMIGPYDLLSRSGLTSRGGVVLRGSYQNSDAIAQMIPWTSLNWTEVHHGFAPLWNPYNGLGLPLAFNWQSASFGLPSLLSYAVPLRDAYTTVVVATLVIAGTGAYVMGRVLRLGFLGALTIATVFELSGPLVAWLGYPQSQVMAYGGWLFAASILVVRGTRRAPAIALFAVVIALAIYAGHPESLIVMAAALAVFLVVLLASRGLGPRLGLTSGGPVLRPMLDVVLGTVAGAALGSPLLLPALQLTASSVRSGSGLAPAPPIHDALYVVFAGFDGAPVPGDFAFGGSFFYNETAAYVGSVAVVLALVGVAVGIRRRRSEVLALAMAAASMAAVTFWPPLLHVAEKVPELGNVAWLRALMPLSLGLAALAGVGLDEIVRAPRSRTVRVSLMGGFASAAIVMAALWLFGRNGGLLAFAHSVEVHERAESFWWPAAGVVVGVVGAALLWWKSGTSRAVALLLLAVEALFLVTAGAVQIASSTTGISATPAVSTLQRVVGNATVGSAGSLKTSTCAIGVAPEANIAFHVHELNLYDPIVPISYFSEWQQETGTSAGNTHFNIFCPSITTVAEARAVGVGFILEPSGEPGPPGTRLVARLATPADPYPAHPVIKPPVSEDLYRVPGAAQATLTAIPSGTRWASLTRRGTPVPVSDPDPAKWTMVTDAPTSRALQIHLTDVPGWRATIDGRPLALLTTSVFSVEARIPPGRHVIKLYYWPVLFTVGLVAALLAALALAGGLVIDIRGRRRGKVPDLIVNRSIRNRR